MERQIEFGADSYSNAGPLTWPTAVLPACPLGEFEVLSGWSAVQLVAGSGLRFNLPLFQHLRDARPTRLWSSRGLFGAAATISCKDYVAGGIY